MADSFKRQTAYLCTAAQLIEGEFVKQDGWEPNYVVASVGMLSRVRLAGIIVKQSSPMQFSLDDGSAVIGIRFFDPQAVPELNIGDPVVVIGRPRDVGNERFVIVEIARKLNNPQWLISFRKLRDELQRFIPPAPARPAQAPDDVVEQTLGDASAADQASSEELLVDAPRPKNKAQVLVDIIRELDPGDGAPTDEVLKKADFEDAENKLSFLINEGEVFELRAGKVKVLE